MTRIVSRTLISETTSYSGVVQPRRPHFEGWRRGCFDLPFWRECRCCYVSWETAEPSKPWTSGERLEFCGDHESGQPLCTVWSSGVSTDWNIQIVMDTVSLALHMDFFLKNTTLHPGSH